MEIKAGQLAFVKTTGEPVFVLSDNILNNENDLGRIVRVRRPVMGEAGMHHVIEEFYALELESLDSQRKRQMAEFGAMKAQVGLAEEIPANNFKN